ncbi:glycosyltransferase [Methanobrevibacter millerae]|uniref:Glycosyl transferase GT2 family n=1 Tax=Methanobrevibacter millerae TaxID=230361 RepID=A0A0U3EDP7_9EURY|nr:glycosyltransferase [Methanobrevibacter millerae]ALT69745.1 glycosyl transferase GT2 family [Methanobrevibacter millerae]
MNQIKISVIMPVYNDEKVIRESLDSVFNQTLTDLEVICINDGSTDNSLKILKNYKSKYGEKIKIFNQENQGSGIARNNAMIHTNGEYIAFLDSDDMFIDKTALEQMYDVAIKDDTSMISANLKVIDLNGELIINKNLRRFSKHEILKPEDYGIPYSFYKNIFKREFIIDNNFKFPDLLRGQDPVFFAEILSKLDNFSTVPVDFYALRSAGNNFGKINTHRKKHDYIEHFKLVFEILQNSGFDNLSNQYKNQLFYYLKSPENSSEDKNEIKNIVHDVFKDDELIINACDSFFNKIKVSLIIPVYNAEEFLDESINSLLNQTLKDIELVCVNDGSKDNSLKMLEDFAKNDDRIKIINQENQGCGAARNKALDNAKGDYIYFFDPDDYLTPNALEKLYDNAISNNSDFVIFKIASFRDGEPINYDEPGFEFEKIFNDVDFDNFTFNYRAIKRHVLLSSFAPWTKFYKKEFLDKYNDFRFHTNVAFDDVPFHVQSMIRAERISYVPEFFYHYRLSNPNSVNNTASNAPDIFKIIDYVENFLENEGCFDEFREDFSIFKITQLSMYISSSHSEDYFKMVKLAIEDMNFLNTDAYVGIIKRNNALKRFNAIMNSNSIMEYKLNLSNDSVDLGFLENNIYLKEIDRIQNEISNLALFSKDLEKNFEKIDNNINLNKELYNSVKILAKKDNNLNVSFKYNQFNSSNESNKIMVLEDRNKYLLKKYNELLNKRFFNNIFKK